MVLRFGLHCVTSLVLDMRLQFYSLDGFEGVLLHTINSSSYDSVPLQC